MSLLLLLINPSLLIKNRNLIQFTVHYVLPSNKLTNYVMLMVYQDQQQGMYFSGHKVNTQPLYYYSTNAVLSQLSDTCLFYHLLQKKHTPICQKTVAKKRKVFDSSRQRAEGTDISTVKPIKPKVRKQPDVNITTLLHQKFGPESSSPCTVYVPFMFTVDGK